MSKLIVIDDGHGIGTAGKRTPIFTDGTTSKETGKNFMYENEFNRAVGKYLDVELRRNGFRTLLVAPTDEDTSLATRVARANNAKADFYLSIHANANTGSWGSWGGTETFTSKSVESLRIGKIIHKHLMQGTPLRDRGVKDGSSLYVIRNTNMPSVLVECAFMDNLLESKLLLNDAFRRECAIEIAKGICEGYGVKYNTETVVAPAPALYRVRSTWADAKSQIGAFSDLDKAKALADSKKGYKVYNDDGSVAYKPATTTPTPPVTPPKPVEPVVPVEPVIDEHKGHNDIMGKSEVSVEKMVAFVLQRFPYATDIEEIAKQFIEVGNTYGIRGDVAFCQSIIETGWFKFDGGTAVTPNQNNYCGLGVTTKGLKGNEFTTVKDGVTAQIQHLFAYASKNDIPNGEIMLDPRFKYVTRGIAPHWEDLSNRWAMNANYGAHIVSMYNQLVEFKYVAPTPPVEEEIQVPPTEEQIKSLIDYFIEKLKSLFGRK